MHYIKNIRITFSYFHTWSKPKTLSDFHWFSSFISNPFPNSFADPAQLRGLGDDEVAGQHIGYRLYHLVAAGQGVFSRFELHFLVNLDFGIRCLIVCEDLEDFYEFMICCLK